MTRSTRLLVAVLAAGVVADLHARVPSSQSSSSVLQRFLARGDSPPVEYRALRRIEANNPHFGKSAWMEAWTEYDPTGGFRYEVVGEGGSGDRLQAYRDELAEQVRGEPLP